MKSRQLISRFIKVRSGFSAISFMTARLISVSSDRFYPMGYLKSGSETNKRHYGFPVWKDISLTGNIPTDHVRAASDIQLLRTLFRTGVWALCQLAHLLNHLIVICVITI